MKSFAPSLLLGITLVAPAAHAAAADPSLLGCWRAVRIVLHNPDGSKTEDTSGRCTLQFMEDRFASTCGTSTGAATTTYQYRIPRPNVYAATMTSSTFRTSLVGATREYEYRVEGERLVTLAVKQAASDDAPAGAPRVESEAVKMACP